MVTTSIAEHGLTTAPLVTCTPASPSTNMHRIRQLTEELTEDQMVCCLFFKLAPDLLCVVDSGGYFKMVNNAWTAMLGWSTKELTSIPITKLIHPDDVESTREIQQRLLDDHDVIKFCNRYRRKPGTIDESGQIVGNNDYVPLEWSATTCNNGLIYAVARKCGC